MAGRRGVLSPWRSASSRISGSLGLARVPLRVGAVRLGRRPARLLSAARILYYFRPCQRNKSLQSLSELTTRWQTLAFCLAIVVVSPLGGFVLL